MEKTELHENDLLYGIRVPLDNCKHCHGTGKEAWAASGEPILCRCLGRNSSKDDWITYGRFHKICNNRRSKNEGFDNNPGTDEVHTTEAAVESKET